MRRLTEQLPLRRGAHPTRELGMCAMEMVAWLAGEPHSDEPQCACPVLAALVRACNDTLSDADRNRYLRPLVPRLVNTRGTAADERARGFLVVDCVVRELLPAWLQRRRLAEAARQLRELPPITDAASAHAARFAIDAYAGEQHAASWVLQRAIDGVAPARYVAGLARVASANPAAETWPLVVARIERMAAIGRVGGALPAIDAD